jgi:hypothetical protein
MFIVKTNFFARCHKAIGVALCLVSMATIEAQRSLRADTLQELLAREWRYELREDPQLATFRRKIDLSGKARRSR